MHSHEVCEQLMAAARRTGRDGRMEYLATRCDMQHKRLDDPSHERPDQIAATP